MNLRNLTDHELDLQTKKSVAVERMSTLDVIAHQRENERRMLYAKMSYKDLKTYCVQELKLSEGSAWRRIEAMRLLKDVPAAAEKLQSGELNLVQASMAQAFFRREKSSAEEKREILSEIENLTNAATARVFAERGRDTKPQPRERPVKGGGLEVTFVMDEELQAMVAEIEILLNKKLSKLELFRLMATQTLERLQKESRRSSAPRWNGESTSRSASRVTVREIKIRDEHRCQYRDPANKQCEARHNLQTEHRIPFAKGGPNDIDNLELLCPAHNRLRAVEEFGAEKMKSFISSLQ